MRTFQSHKRVKAAQIAQVIGRGEQPGLTLVLSNGMDGEYVDCPPEMFTRYVPSSGDYLVEYEDGYRSISPKKAFEDGYTEVAA